MKNLRKTTINILSKVSLSIFILFISLCLDSCYKCEINENNTTSDAVQNNNKNSNNNKNNELVYSFNIDTPLKVKFKSWQCPNGWVKIYHSELKNANNDAFFWCEPESVPILKLDDYLTIIDDDENIDELKIANPADNGTFPVLGNPEPQPLGDTCGEDIWPNISPDNPAQTIYVYSDSSQNGTGTIENPYNNINTAIQHAEPDSIVIIGSGIYEESITLHKSISLIGNCIQKTSINVPGPHLGLDSGAIIIKDDVKVTLKNLKISGQQNGIYINS